MKSEHPNILIFMTDNQPAELLGCYGNDEILTPHIDALSGDGLRFDNAFCVNGMCSPCRASVMTGLMPSQHGLHTWIDDRLKHLWPDNWNAIEEFKTLPEILLAGGYHTALIGKYHMGAPDRAQNGFQHWITSPHGHVTDFWNNTFIENDTMRSYPGHSVDYFTEQTIEYIESRVPADTDAKKVTAPFFAFVPYNAPYGHWPALKGRAKNRFRDHYDSVEMHSIPREGLHENAIVRFLRKASDSVGGIDHSSELRIPNDLETLRNYYSEMSMVDDGVGRVLATLKRLNIYDDTLIIYTADHGFSLGHHGIWGHSQATLPSNAHRATFSIPLIFRHGKRFVSGANADFISQIDLFPTVLELAGMEAEGYNANSPARQFTAALHGGGSDNHSAVFLEQEETRAIRNERWLYKRRFQKAPQPPYPDEMYDLVADPLEKTNLAGKPEFAEIAKDLIAQIDVFFNQYSDPKYDLWNGGSPKSSSDKPWLWKEAWGEDWNAEFVAAE
jgi:arylsulfatase A-like enzyme